MNYNPAAPNPKKRITMRDEIELSILMPCLNEAETIATCIKKAKKSLEKLNINGEIVISDNGSTDGSQAIAKKLGARVINVKEKDQGYGSGIRWGVAASRGKYVIMGDSDDSYDFSKLEPFIDKLREGYDLVMGNRYKGGIKKGAMPVLHRYLGNPVISFLGRLFFNVKIGDFNCGLRGFTKKAFQKINPQTRGMDMATEIVVKAALKKVKITEVPTTLSPDGRSREPHLNTWSDGWRVLRFLLLFSPAWVFLYPGIILTFISLVLGALIHFEPVQMISEVFLGIKSMIYIGFFFLIGFQLIFFYYFARIYAVANYIVPKSSRCERLFDFFTLERGLFAGIFLLSVGLALGFFNIFEWSKVDFGGFNQENILKTTLYSAISITLGVQVIIYSFIYSILGLKLRWPDTDGEDLKYLEEVDLPNPAGVKI